MAYAESIVIKNGHNFINYFISEPIENIFASDISTN